MGKAGKRFAKMWSRAVKVCKGPNITLTLAEYDPNLLPVLARAHVSNTEPYLQPEYDDDYFGQYYTAKYHGVNDYHFGYMY